AEIADVAHDHGARVLVDAAQSAPHRPVDVTEMGADAVAMSGHKACGPSGTGALYLADDLIDDLQPFLVGGETVTDTTYGTATFADPPHRFEAGLQDVAGIAGFGAACEFLQDIGRDEIHAHERRLTERMHTGVRAIDGVRPIGATPPDASGICNVAVEGMDAHEASLLLDRTADVAVRSGMHCLHAWYNDREIGPTVRASVYLYNTEADVDAFLDGLEQVVALG
ncbi:MAG: aminotransferase class V-fold PLP-dependent enzyme, partial [Halodesulfurarchaeum sp.]